MFNYVCIYIGTKNHPECEGVLGIDNNIKFISNIMDIENLNVKNDNIYVTNQTTLSKFDMQDIIYKLLNKYLMILLA